MAHTLPQVAPRRSNAPLSDLDRNMIERLEAMYGPRPQPAPKFASGVAVKQAPVASPAVSKRRSPFRRIAFVMFTIVALAVATLIVATPEGQATYDQAASQIAPVVGRAQDFLGSLSAPQAP